MERSLPAKHEKKENFNDYVLTNQYERTAEPVNTAMFANNYLKKFGEGQGQYVVNQIEQSKKNRRPEAGDYFELMFNEEIKLSGSGQDVKFIESFEEAISTPGLLANIRNRNYEKPLPIQKATLSLITAGYDVIGHAGTGCGKTAAFLLPIIDWILKKKAARNWIKNSHPLCIIVAPVKELAEQLYTDACIFSDGLNCQSVLSFGEIPRRENMAKIRSGCDILIATVGRLCDYVCNNVINLDSLKFLVFDEADRLFDQNGFSEDLKNHFFPKCSYFENIQKLLFSATDCADLNTFKREVLRANATTVIVGSMNSVSRFVKQTIIEVDACGKIAELLRLLEEEFAAVAAAAAAQTPSLPPKVIIFVNTKRRSSVIACYLSLKGFKAYPMHGDLTTSLRREAIEALVNGACNILVSTDITARGLDLKDITHVINYEIPKRETWATYVHRVGRTGRVGNVGRATTFYVPSFDAGMALVLYQWLIMNEQEVPEFLLQEASRQAAENDLQLKAEQEYQQVMRNGSFVPNSDCEDDDSDQ